MPVVVEISFTLADDVPAHFGTIVESLLWLPGVVLRVHGPSTELIDLDLDEMEAALVHAREQFRASVAEIDRLKERIDAARSVNTWLRRTQPVAALQGESST